MKLVLSKHKLFIFKRKWSTGFENQFYESYITLIDCTSTENLGSCTDSKLYFHNWLYIFLNPSISLHFQVARSLPSLAVYCTVFSSVGTKLQAASMTESNELERIQRKFAAPLYNRFFPQFVISVCRSYTNTFDYLKLCTLPESRRHLKALIMLIFTFVPNCILRLWILLFFSFVLRIWKSFMCFIWTHKNFPSVGSKSVLGVVCGDVDIYIYRKNLFCWS